MRKWMETYLPALLVMATTCGIPVYSTAQAPRYDLLLKGGHVIDPANNVDGIMDVAVSKDKIAAVGKDIPATQAGKVVNVSGLYVTPGLIDIHFHIGHGGAPLNWFTPEARAHTAPLGIPAELALQSAVTSAVDAGTSAAQIFLQEKEAVIAHANDGTHALLAIGAHGMHGGA